jgi:hypothetical protein
MGSSVVEVEAGLRDRWMSASMTEVQRLLQRKSGKAKEAEDLLFRSSSRLQLLFRNRHSPFSPTNSRY